MKVNDFDYNLPVELIAQTPLDNRSNSRLLITNRQNGKLEHDYFYNLVNYLHEGDILVLNDTKVMPSRIIGKKVDTDAKIEFLLLKEIDKDIYEVLAKPFRRLNIGTIIDFANIISATVLDKGQEGICRVKFSYQGLFIEQLEKIGQMPLPPYIHEKLDDHNRYQTIYAQDLGSAAAPTAGLHFTKELIAEIKNKGVILKYITLHVGLGTFRPVSVEEVTDHKMHHEWYKITQEVAASLNEGLSTGKRIIAVGTTSARALEAVYLKYQKFIETCEETDIFIYPGYQFKVISGLITNFHLPKSTLLMLVSAFSSREIILKAYQEAINKKYRFFSFGDAMFII